MINDLQDIRKEIDAIDQKMVVLFEARMQLAKEVATYKAEHDLPIFDAEREREIIAERSQCLEHREFLSYYQDFLTQLMRISKELQTDLISKTNNK